MSGLIRLMDVLQDFIAPFEKMRSIDESIGFGYGYGYGDSNGDGVGDGFSFEHGDQCGDGNGGGDYYKDFDDEPCGHGSGDAPYEKGYDVDSDNCKKVILVIERGWVLVGDVSEQDDRYAVKNGFVIRKWGTDKGIGHIAQYGPTKDTVLDQIETMAYVPKEKIVFSLDCGNAWK